VPHRTGRHYWPIAAIVIVTAAAGWIGFHRGGAAPAPSASRRDNVLLVTLDTTRADHLGCYGRAQARTRHLDRLAAEGVRFEAAYSPAPITLPAHASIFTALYPPAHGVRNNGNFYLPERFETLATVLRGQGYHTAAFVSSFILDRRYGLARGFETYDDAMGGARPQVVSLEAERRGDHTALALSRWLDDYAARRDAPFFVWLHLYDPHEPYRPPSPFREAFAASPYDGEVAFDDAVFASIRDKLDQLGLLEGTLIAVIGDHGESLGDHGEETHSMFVYESAVHVPLILWRPGRLPAGRVVKDLVRATDLAPTLLDLVGAPPIVTAHGRSLVPLLEGKALPSRPIYAETLLPLLYMNWAPLHAIRDERYKLIDAPRPELYDLARDPGETDNRYEAEPSRAAALHQALASEMGGGEGAMSAGRLDQETVEKLAALGYVGAGAHPESAPRGSQKDPKDVIGVFNRLRRANSAVRDRRFDDALPILHEVIAADPANAFARVVLGSAYMGMGRNDEAIRWFKSYVELVPSSSYAHQWMAICQLRQGRRDEALREAAAALAIDPRFTDALILRGGVLAARGEHTAAVAELRKAVAIDPAKPMVRLDLAKVLAEQGRPGEAEAEYGAIVRLQPDYAPALTGLGVLQARQGKLAAAAETLGRALRADPSQDSARFDLAGVLERQGRREEAAAEYRRLVGADGTSAEVRAAARARLSQMGEPSG
jgi:arylsulfatase A-like enzyme/thioredoxin-like negative regulator of GroEL